MVTTIDNNQKVFMLVGYMGKQVFCNLKDVKTVLNTFVEKKAVKIYYFWNNKPKRVYIKELNEMLSSHRYKKITKK